jgi:hypothetical protein
VKQAIVIAGLVIAGMLAWFLASNLSSDALGMGVGVIFGVLSGIPTALLVMASGRRRSYDDDGALDADRREQPLVIVLAAPRAQAQPQTPRVQETHYHYHAGQSGPPPVSWTAQQRGELMHGQAQPPAQQGRVFRIVGQREEWVE